jgi:hypothetical protein
MSIQQIAAIALCILAVIIVVPLYWYATQTGGRR